MIWLEIQLPNSKPFLLCYVYRLPNSPSAWVCNYENVVEKAYSEEKEIIILGDFNIDLLGNIPQTWSSCNEAYTLNQLITEPTRIFQHTSTLIDHIYTTNSEKHLLQ